LQIINDRERNKIAWENKTKTTKIVIKNNKLWIKDVNNKKTEYGKNKWIEIKRWRKKKNNRKKEKNTGIKKRNKRIKIKII
jgi:hypothetical protein